MSKTATTYDYQARGREFAVNDFVHPVGSGPMDIGRVSQVWPGIGMVQVEFPYGSRRYPVEDVEKIHPAQSLVIPTTTDNGPGGADVVPVSAGRPPSLNEDGGQETATGKDTTIEMDVTTGPDGGASPASKTGASLTTAQMADRIIEAHIKKALYWHSADRNYRVNKGEFESGKFACPKCKDGPMKRAIYKMRNAERHRLYICPNCTFVIKQDNIHSDHVTPPEPTVMASDRSKKVREIVSKFPPDSKKGRGDAATLMLTGDVAKALGKKDYDSVKVGDLSDAQINKLHAAVAGGR